MTFHLSNKVAVIISDAEMMKSVGAQVGDSDGLAEQGRDIEGILVSILFKEDRHPTEDKILWRISLRSKTDQINLSELAEKFGGGGHKVAAAFRSTKPRAEIEEKLLAELTPLVAAVK